MPSQAHHLLPVNNFGDEIGIKLHKWGVDLNGAENGVWLPEYTYPRYNGSTHKGGHFKSYTETVVERLEEATDKESAIAILDEIRDDLLNRRLVLQSADSTLP